jgi:Leucine-rich repeat (LRR) protein
MDQKMDKNDDKIKEEKCICYGMNLTSLPTLSPLLTELSCGNNPITHIPILPNTLRVLVCNNIGLTYLPGLPATLTSLYCQHNRLPELPMLPPNLGFLACHSNELIIMPDLPSPLKYLYCDQNPLIYKEPTITNINIINKRLKQYAFWYQCQKYRHRYRHWLWGLVREKKAMAELHPTVLTKLLDQGLTIDDIYSVFRD